MAWRGCKTRSKKLLTYPADAELWEKEILPARLSPYFTSWMDTLIQESELIWMGAEKGQGSMLCFPDQQEFFN